MQITDGENPNQAGCGDPEIESAKAIELMQPTKRPAAQNQGGRL
jgi:hypothetical protein